MPANFLVPKIGRPSVMTQLVVSKLEYAFSIGSTVTEACGFAGITRQTLYEFIEKDKLFADRIESLREQPVLKARETIVQRLNDPEFAKYYLSKKRPDEFGEQTNPGVLVPVQVNVNSDRERFK